ncbi:protein-disulfide reductase DsbD family protein [Marinimicrobium agarilyticum]|uniref:protein-disulfide reductase DsbD family protein n=1 Tax=Marinimicrobium agarilyticum TaxID=306546 RepID=UPI0003FD7086|nr:protein-disulfide reductase DsbD [Marinimicrobium agarilyticum]
MTLHTRLPLMARLLTLVTLLLACATAQMAQSDDFLEVTEAFQLDTQVSDDQLILRWAIAPEYYLYQERFRVKVNGEPLTPQFSEGETKYDDYFEKDMVVHYGNATLMAALPAKATAFNLAVTSQGCADAGLCYPPHTEHFTVDPTSGLVTPGSGAEPATTAEAITQPEAPTSSLWLLQAVGFALLGGMILNLMPCVFPVLSIKVMSLAQADRSHMARHGWAYTAGIMVCFLAFSGILMLARAGGEAIGWGFQLQSPLLVAALAYLFFIMGLSLSGLINIGTGMMGAGQSLTQRSGLSGSFFTGVLAAVVASPCTAPFMGAALGFALTQPGLVGLTVFAALGLGMALPLLLLCHMPALARRLPRPGAWMETLKELLAFPLYITALWLVWVLGRQVGLNAAMVLCLGGVAIAFALWLMNRPAGGWAQYLRRAGIAAAWVAAIVVPWQMLTSTPEHDRWQPYSAETLAELRAQGTPVFVNLTADWCITCMANEKVALGTEQVNNAFEELGVVTLKGDWTNRDPEITALLDAYGRSGVPLYLWFPSGHTGDGKMLPQLLTADIVEGALRSNEALANR